MTGAYAQNWPGREPWGQHGGRGSGPQGRGRHGGRGEEQRGENQRAEGRGEEQRGEGRGRGEGRRRDPRGRAEFPIEALLGWAMARGKGPDRGPGPGPDRGSGRGPGRGPGTRPDPENLERLEAMMAMRQMRGRGPAPSGRGPRGRGRRRRGDVRLAVLRLLAEEPRNGYGLIQTIEERAGGQWRPSPGSIYPTLSQLEDEGLIRSLEAEAGRRFEITDAGRAALAERAGEPDPWTPEPDADESAMSELGPLVMGIGKAAWQVAAVADAGQRARAVELLDATRRGLYAILAEGSRDADASPDTGEDDEPSA